MSVLEHVRIATVEDLPALLDFAKAFHKESPYRNLRFDYGKTWASYKQVIEAGGLNSIVLIAHEGGKPLGMVAAVCDSPVFSSDRVATELAWYIGVPYRKSRKAFLLFQAYEEWARRVGCDYVQGAYLIGEGQADLQKFYEHKGYKGVEMSYIKSLKGVFDGNL